MHTNTVCSQVSITKMFISVSCSVLKHRLCCGTVTRFTVQIQKYVYCDCRESYRDPFNFGNSFVSNVDFQVFYILLNVLFKFVRFSRSYLHSCEPPIIHGNLTCDTIFIQHNGLIKIGSGRDPLKWKRCFRKYNQDLPLDLAPNDS